MKHNEHASEQSNITSLLGYGALAAAAALVLAPHILPALGVGEEAYSNTVYQIHRNSVDYGKTIFEASKDGLAGKLNYALASIPFAGETLAQGGWMNALASVSIGIGGVSLGSRLSEAGNRMWGNLLTTAAITTSALISLPTLLSGLTMGVIFLGQLFSEDPSKIAALMLNTLGQAGSSLDNHYLGLSGLAAAIPHALTCGVAIVPAAFGISAATKHAEDAKGTNEEVCVSISLDAPTRAGQETHATLKLNHADTGAPLSQEELAVVHTKKLHLFVIDKTLKDYQHIHPTPTQNAGEFTFSFTPKTGNSYSAWADLTLIEGENHRIQTVLPAAQKRNIRATLRPNDVANDGFATFTWNATKSLRAGEDNMVEITMRDSMGNPLADLQPIMGSTAHLVGFGADGESFIHIHPVSHNGRLQFHIVPETPGPAQFYLQIKRGGKEEFIPFGQIILPAAQAVSLHISRAI